MSRSELTIGELAGYTGVTVRAIRHYHQRGLLPEPPRDGSGYRRYDAQAVLHLLRIKVLAESGVPLARVGELLDADPQRFAEALEQIDAALCEQATALERRRQRIAELAQGDRVLLPPALVAYLDALNDLGLSPATIAVERDGWVLLLARVPQHAQTWLAQKHALLADPEFRQLTREYDRAAAWEPTDPRLDDLADRVVGYAERRALTTPTDLHDDGLLAVVGALVDEHATPALDRLHALVEQRQA